MVMKMEQKTIQKINRFNQFIQYKALSFKFDNSSMLIDAVIEDDKENRLPLKNVCAKLHVSLVKRLDNRLNALSISKREFIEYAIIEALDKTDEIMEEVDALEFLIEQAESKEVKS